MTVAQATVVERKGMSRVRLWLGRALAALLAMLGIAYALPSYMATIRPDELKFSKQGEMLSFASARRLVLE